MKCANSMKRNMTVSTVKPIHPLRQERRSDATTHRSFRDGAGALLRQLWIRLLGGLSRPRSRQLKRQLSHLLPCKLMIAAVWLVTTKKALVSTLDSGETLSLNINTDAFEQSTHGSNNVTCVTCHSDISSFPHPERTTETLRDVKLKYYTSCQQCHAEQFTQTLDSVHQKSLAAGNKNAAVCADCHNPHTQQKITDDAGNAPSVCPSAYS